MKRSRLKRKSGLKKRSRKFIGVKALDELWSRVVRKRSGWKCIIPGCTKAPQGCHIYPKGSYPGVRHDPDNGFAACYGHHIHGWHKDPDVQEKIRWLLEVQRGAGFMERARLRALTAQRPDRAAIRIALELELR